MLPTLGQVNKTQEFTIKLGETKQVDYNGVVRRTDKILYTYSNVKNKMKKKKINYNFTYH